MLNFFLLAASPLISLVLIIGVISWRKQQTALRKLTDLYAILQEQDKAFHNWTGRLDERALQHQSMVDSVLNLLKEQQKLQQEQRSQFDSHQFATLKTLQDSLQMGMTSVRQQVAEALTQNTDILSQRVEKLTQTTDQRLREINAQVEQRLTQGFEKTTATFTDVIKRLAIIDEAQRRITELSTNVVSLQEILADKRSRGAFGEVQLMALIRNVMPESSFAFQHTLKNDLRADCILFLPEPTGNVVIDSKFPLESFRLITDNQLSSAERKNAESTFRKDIRAHIDNIAKKYIVAGETADGAMMFIPAEAVFAEIHAHYPDLVEHAYKLRVWMVSPTTMMAILTTARAVLKDVATRQQVHIIQEHLGLLSKDFHRFGERMTNLAKHIKNAHQQAEEVQISSRKITQRFNQIEKVELPLDIENPGLLMTEEVLENSVVE